MLCIIKESQRFGFVVFFIYWGTILQWLLNCDFRIYYAQIQTASVALQVHSCVELMKYPYDTSCIQKSFCPQETVSCMLVLHENPGRKMNFSCPKNNEHSSTTAHKSFCGILFPFVHHFFTQWFGGVATNVVPTDENNNEKLLDLPEWKW